MENNKTKIYALIGSRQTPIHICKTFEEIAEKLAKKGYILRSGGAEGADQAGEIGCDKCGGKKEVYIPWKGFNNSTSPLYNVSAKAVKMASEVHPAWDKCSKWVQKLHGRNCNQVLGSDLNTPCEFVVCWTLKGEKCGGTATALSLAEKHNIPIYNFGRPEDIERFSKEVLPITIDENKGYLYSF